MISLPLLFLITALLLKSLNHVSIETNGLPGKAQRINTGGAVALRNDNIYPDTGGYRRYVG